MNTTAKTGARRDLIGERKAEFYDRFAASHTDEEIYWAQGPTPAWYIVSRRRRALIRIITARTGAGDRVLDVGCGDGHHLADLPGHLEKAGTDIAQVHVDRTRTRIPGCDARVTDGARLPFEDEAFDLTYSTEVIEHVEDPAGFVRELARVTRPGGPIVITTPSFLGLYPGSLIWRWNVLARANRILDRAAHFVAITLRRPRHALGKIWERLTRRGRASAEPLEEFSHHHLWIFSPRQIERFLNRAGCRVVKRTCVGLNLPLMPLWTLLLFHVPPARWLYQALDGLIASLPGVRWFNHTMILVAEHEADPGGDAG